MLPADTDWSLFAKTAPVLQPNASGFAGPEAIAGVIAALASDDGKWVTGTDIRIDGGAHG
jgi:NAD(P)-dependent dehydrogenase (short-subunit alcohol dehydrogenase family)